jgi:hypothetical protein
VAEVASLASPAANAYRAYKLATGGGFSVTGADMQDVEQAVEAAGVIPTGKAATIPLKVGSRGAKALIPRATEVATNPLVVNSLMDATRVASSGGRPGEVIATGIASLLRGEAAPVKTSSSLLPGQHADILEKGLDAPAKRPGRKLPSTLAANVQTAMRRPLRGETKRVPASEMEVKFSAEDQVALVNKSPNIIKDNTDYISLYEASNLGQNKPNNIFIHAHPPGINPADVRRVKPDHITSGVLNELESKVNGARRDAGLEPLTKYRDIVSEGIKLAEQGKFGDSAWNSKLAGKTLEEAKVYMGAVGVDYW